MKNKHAKRFKCDSSKTVDIFEKNTPDKTQLNVTCSYDPFLFIKSNKNNRSSFILTLFLILSGTRVNFRLRRKHQKAEEKSHSSPAAPTWRSAVLDARVALFLIR